MDFIINGTKISRSFMRSFIQKVYTKNDDYIHVLKMTVLYKQNDDL